MSDPVPVESTVLAVLEDVLGEPAASLRAQPVLAAHDWNSVASLEVLAQLESRLGVVLDLRSYHGVRTLDDLVRLVETVAMATPTAGRP